MVNKKATTRLYDLMKLRGAVIEALSTQGNSFFGGTNGLSDTQELVVATYVHALMTDEVALAIDKVESA